MEVRKALVWWIWPVVSVSQEGTAPKINGRRREGRLADFWRHPIGLDHPQSACAFPDAKRLPDQTGLGWRRRPIEMQTPLLVSVLRDATECEPTLSAGPAARRLVSFVLGRDAQ
jgi:hypothetical protein